MGTLPRPAFPEASGLESASERLRGLPRGVLLGAALSFTLGKDGVAVSMGWREAGLNRRRPVTGRASRFPTARHECRRPGGRWGFLASPARVKSQSCEAGERSVPRMCVDASGVARPGDPGDTGWRCASLMGTHAEPLGPLGHRPPSLWGTEGREGRFQEINLQTFFGHLTCLFLLEPILRF